MRKIFLTLCLPKGNILLYFLRNFYLIANLSSDFETSLKTLAACLPQNLAGAGQPRGEGMMGLGLTFDQLHVTQMGALQRLQRVYGGIELVLQCE